MIEKHLVLKFIGKDNSMGLRKNNTYILDAKIESNYICLNINGKSVLYTIDGFLSNWEKGYIK